jgi:hypothetical protein
MLDYKGLDANFIMEYCQDNLKESLQKHADKLCQIASLFNQFNFDMLKATVEEMNRYDEPPEDALRMLNVKPEFDSGNAFTMKVIKDGEEVKTSDMETFEWKGNPLQGQVSIHLKEYEDEKDEDGDIDWNWKNIKFDPSHIKKIDSQSGKFVFANAEGVQLVLSKIKDRSYNYMDAF